MDNIQLRPHQVECGERSVEILRHQLGLINTSPTGSGKTFLCLWVALYFSFPILVVCPKSVVEMWKRESAKVGVHTVAVITYESLRSRKNGQPSHGLLTRHDDTTLKGYDKLHFEPTEYYIDIVNHGVLVVFDESHRLKNRTAQFKAGYALLKPIVEMGGLSRFMLLTATPFDKEEHSINYCRLLGFIRSAKLYSRLAGSPKVTRSSRRREVRMEREVVE